MQARPTTTATKTSAKPSAATQEDFAMTAKEEKLMPLSDEEARAWIRDLTTALERRNRENAALRAQLDEAVKAITTLFDAIKHGDETHQAWLKDAIDKHFTSLTGEQR